jgi:hypothetical protein
MTASYPPNTISPIGQVHISSTTICNWDSPVDPQLHGVPPHSPEPNLISSDDAQTLLSSLSSLQHNSPLLQLPPLQEVQFEMLQLSLQ